MYQLRIRWNYFDIKNNYFYVLHELCKHTHTHIYVHVLAHDIWSI